MALTNVRQSVRRCCAQRVRSNDSCSTSPQRGCFVIPRLDELDLALVHALQVAPRASWAEVGRVLGSTPATLAGRWERLRTEGLAWVTVHPGRQIRDVAVAFVDVDLEPSRREETIRALCRDSRAVTIEEAARGRDLMLTVLETDQDALARFVLDDLPRTPGVRRVDTHLATGVHWEGSRWRLDALAPAQEAALETRARRPPASPVTMLPTSHWPLVEALTADGRRSAADLARVTGRNPATVRRQVARLLASDLLSFRCEVAQVQSRWPTVCTWLATVDVDELDRTIRSLTTLPELRLCASTVGSTNLLFTVWARSAGDLLRLEKLLGRELPSLHLEESAVMLRAPKRMGWILDADGRNTGEVVPSPAHTTMRDPAAYG